MNDDTLVQTTVRYGTEWFFVSTVNRDSSSMELNCRYAETLVWQYDPKTRLAGRLIGQFEGTENTIVRHQEIVDRLHKTGNAEQPVEGYDADGLAYGRGEIYENSVITTND